MAISAGVQYTGTSEKTDPHGPLEESSLSPSFVRIGPNDGGQYPVGLIYDDSVKAVGFVGCRPKSSEDVGLVIAEFNKGVDNVVAINDNSDDRFTGLVKGIGALSGKLECNVGVLDSWVEWSIRILGLIGRSSEDREQVGGRRQLFSTVTVNNATMINEARRNAEALCRNVSKNCETVSDERCLGDGVICLKG